MSSVISGLSACRELLESTVVPHYCSSAEPHAAFASLDEIAKQLHKLQEGLSRDQLNVGTLTSALTDIAKQTNQAKTTLSRVLKSPSAPLTKLRALASKHANNDIHDLLGPLCLHPSLDRPTEPPDGGRTSSHQPPSSSSTSSSTLAGTAVDTCAPLSSTQFAHFSSSFSRCACSIHHFDLLLVDAFCREGRFQVAEALIKEANQQAKHCACQLNKCDEQRSTLNVAHAGVASSSSSSSRLNAVIEAASASAAAAAATAADAAVDTHASSVNTASPPSPSCCCSSLSSYPPLAIDPSLVLHSSLIEALKQRNIQPCLAWCLDVDRSIRDELHRRAALAHTCSLSQARARAALKGAVASSSHSASHTATPPYSLSSFSTSKLDSLLASARSFAFSLHRVRYLQLLMASEERLHAFKRDKRALKLQRKASNGHVQQQQQHISKKRKIESPPPQADNPSAAAAASSASTTGDQHMSVDEQQTSSSNHDNHVNNGNNHHDNVNNDVDDNNDDDNTEAATASSSSSSFDDASVDVLSSPPPFDFDFECAMSTSDSESECVEAEWSARLLGAHGNANAAARKSNGAPHRDDESANHALTSAFATTASPSSSSFYHSALQYAQAHFPSFFSTHLDEIQRLLGCLMFVGQLLPVERAHSGTLNAATGNNHAAHAAGASSTSDANASSTADLTSSAPAAHPYFDYFSVSGHSSLWRSCISSFSSLHFSLLQRSAEPPLSVCLAAADEALPQILKFQSVKKMKNEILKGSTANGGKQHNSSENQHHMPELSLSSRFSFHSTLVCPVTKEQCTLPPTHRNDKTITDADNTSSSSSSNSASTSNPPVMLLCGHLISSLAMEKIVKGLRGNTRRFKCPTCPREQTPEDTIVVHF